MLNTPELVLIDVDGTLVDSAPDLAYCVDEMQKQLGLPEHGEEKVRHWIGNGVPRLVERALLGTLDGMPDKALYDKAYPLFLELYQDNVCERSCLYAGAREGIDWMKAQGWHIGCITNKATRFVLPILETLGVHDDFSLIICGDTLEKKKPDPMPLLHSAKHYGVAPENSLMLGDSISDVKAARAANFDIVCMSYGYNHGDDIRLANPDAVIDSFMELPNLLKN
jgi:phosphoglycolate phosphatase